MSNVSKQVQIAVQIDRSPKTLARLMTAVAAAGSRTLACCSYQNPAGTVVVLVTDDPRRTIRALEADGFPCKTNPVVLIDTTYQRGLTAGLRRQLTAEHIAVLYSYLCWEENNRVFAVFKTADDERTIQVLQAVLLRYDVTRQGKPNRTVPPWDREPAMERLAA